MSHKKKPPSRKRYFLSFIGEGVENQAYRGYLAGRLEVTENHEIHGKEYRYLTNKKEAFCKFSDFWDFKRVNSETLRRILRKMKTEFLEGVK